MNKDTVIKLIKNTPIKQEEFNQLILDYIEFKGKPTPTAEQFQVILGLINSGAFSLFDLKTDLIKHFNLQVNILTGKNNELLKIEVYG